MLKAAHVVQHPNQPTSAEAMTDIMARSIVSKDLVPSVVALMPHAASAELPETRREGAAVVYFPACINRIFGRDNTKRTATPALPDAFAALRSAWGASLGFPMTQGSLLHDAVEFQGLQAGADMDV